MQRLVYNMHHHSRFGAATLTWNNFSWLRLALTSERQITERRGRSTAQVRPAGKEIIATKTACAQKRLSTDHLRIHFTHTIHLHVYRPHI